MLVNLTRHSIDVYDDDENLIASIPPSGIVAELVQPKLEIEAESIGSSRVRRFEAAVRGVRGIPAPEPGTLYVVDNSIAKEGRHDRDDLVTPYRYVRRDGSVIGCKAFVRFT